MGSIVATMGIFGTFMVALIIVLVIRALMRVWGAPKPRKPSINSGRAEKAALTGGLLAALFFAGRNHNKRGF